MKEYKKIFHGCIDLEENEKGLLPLRIIGNVLERYENDPDTPYARMGASTYLEFTTDAEEITFHYEAEKTFYIPIVFDIYENGVFEESYISAYGWLDGDVVYKIRKKNAVVRIYAPASCRIRYSNFKLGNWRPIEGTGKKMLVYGDSICQGLFGKNPSLAVVPTIARILDLEYLNVSVGGERYRPDMVESNGYQPDYIMIALGTNDWAYDVEIEQLKTNVKAYYKRIETLYPKAKVFVVSPIQLIADMNAERRSKFESIRNTIIEIANQKKMKLIDGYEMIPFNHDFYADDAHPNDLGFQQYATNLTIALKDFII